MSVSLDGSLMATRSSTDELMLVTLPDADIRRTEHRILGAPEFGGDGRVYFTGLDSAVYRIPEDAGAEPEPLPIERSPGEYHQDFWPLEDGSAAILGVGGGGDRWIEAVDLQAGTRTRLIDGCSPRTTDTGHLLFLTEDGRLMAARLDPSTLQLGSPVVVSDEIEPGCPGFLMSLAPDGSVLAYWAGNRGTHELVWVTRSGGVSSVDPSSRFDPGGGNLDWTLSPDGRRAAVRIGTTLSNMDIWIKDLQGDAVQRLTFFEGEDRSPSWPSDSVVVFLSEMGGDGQRRIFSRRADGVGPPELLYDHPGRRLAAGLVSPDGRWLIVRTSGLDDSDLLAIRIGADSLAIPLIASPQYAIRGPSFSPDGQWLAYSMNATGIDEVMVRPFPQVNRGQYQVSTGGGHSPVWARDGSEIFYVTPDREVVAARVETTPSFRVLGQDVLFELGPEYDIHPVIPFADVAADGRFLMMRQVDAATADLVLITNFDTWLRERVPN